jgi:hypothetical protein
MIVGVLSQFSKIIQVISQHGRRTRFQLSNHSAVVCTHSQRGPSLQCELFDSYQVSGVIDAADPRTQRAFVLPLINKPFSKGTKVSRIESQFNRG